MSEVFLQQLGVVCALGHGVDKVRKNLLSAQDICPLTLSERYSPGRHLPLGLVHATLPSLCHVAPRFQTRNNAMALLALNDIRIAVEVAVARYGPARVAVVVGTSTSGQPEGEAARAQLEKTGAWPANFDYAQQELGNLAEFLATELGLTGAAHVISTACSSGAKALSSGARLLNAGLADAVIAGGSDVLGELTVAGFSALDSVSATRCNPMSKNRNGINLGEGAALFLMTRDEGPVRLAGWGETSDAYHMSAPDPTGMGAIRAMHQALTKGRVRADQIDYLNLHGTATVQNDRMESLAVEQVLGRKVPASSTKPLTGHTLAAAGAVEAAFCWMTLTSNPRGRLPPHWWDGMTDPLVAPVSMVTPGDNLGRPARYLMSNSFAFGGSNASLLMGAS
jgi:3-oxoacyl-[acyl-carrier-protein] synthase I